MRKPPSHKLQQNTVYPHPLARVWSALTDSSALAQWLLPNDFEPRIGHHFTFRGQPEEGWNGLITCEVVELVPLQRLSFTWSAHPNLPEMLVSFVLEESAGGTRLRLTQRELYGVQPTLLDPIEPVVLPPLRLRLDDEQPVPASRYFRISIDIEALTDALFDFVRDPQATRNERPVVYELHRFAPEVVSVLENMVLDGVSERGDVAAYVHFVFGALSA